MTTHELKIKSKYFMDVVKNIKRLKYATTTEITKIAVISRFILNKVTNDEKTTKNN